MRRSSYGDLMEKPAWGLYDAEDVIVASIRADSALEARDLFKKHDLSGAYVRRVENQ